MATDVSTSLCFFIISHELKQTLAICKIEGDRKTPNTLGQGPRGRYEGPQRGIETTKGEGEV
jgi:hypothetical protein